MKKIIVLALSVVSLSAFAQVDVSGYYKSNGTYVAPHHRTAPNSTISDNYSTKGNVNPYTGQAGTVVDHQAEYQNQIAQQQAEYQRQMQQQQLMQQQLLQMQRQQQMQQGIQQQQHLSNGCNPQYPATCLNTKF
jgi:hypothetical protein